MQEAKNNSAGVIDATADKPTADNANSIVATVNDESISDFELRQRVALYLALNGISQQLTPEQRTRMRNQILEMLEDEKIQLQEAEKEEYHRQPGGSGQAHQRHDCRTITSPSSSCGRT